MVQEREISTRGVAQRGGAARKNQKAKGKDVNEK
jgi:hypothetical protein